MYIKEIVCADKEDSEADVIISDGVYTIKCYMYPATDVLVNQKINVIYAFECTDIMRVQSIKYEIKKLQGYYAYMIIAKVINRKEKLICVGKIIIKLDAEISKDINDGDYIKASVVRFDC